MGIVNLYKGLESEKEIFHFSGKLKDNLDLDWEHTQIIKNGEKLSPDYELQENEVLIIQEIPGITTAALVLGIITLVVGIGVGIYAYSQAQKAKREMEDALKRIGKDNKQKDVSSIPQLADARNERVDGKNIPIILGKHLFAPYYLSEPYMRPGGEDGVDLYWYGSFIVGQSGLCFEKIRNGTTNLLTLSGNIPQRGKFSFQNPGGTNPPFYTPENFIEIVQKGNESAINQFTEPVFEQKWSDSLESTVELGRKKKDNAKIGIIENGVFKADENGMFIDDNGEEPIIRPTARFPMRAEIEIRLDGLYSWDSENGVATPASVGLMFEWSKNGVDNWQNIPLSVNDSYIRETILASKSIAEWVNQVIPNTPANGQILDYSMALQNGGFYGSNAINLIVFEKISERSGEEGSYTYSLLYRITFVNTGIWQIVKSSSGTTATIEEDVRIYGAPTVGGNNYITRARAVQMRFLAEVNFPSSVYTKGGDPVYIRATRKTMMHTGTYRSSVYLTAIRTKQYNPEKSTASQLIAAKNINERVVDKFCRMGIKVKANINTQEFMDRFNVITSMVGRTWNNGWSSTKTKTSNSAAVLLELITGLIHNPSKHADQELDLNTFGKLYEFCASRKVEIEGQGLQNLTLECNGVLTSGTRKIDVINSILATCDGGLYINEFGKLEVYFEDTQTIPIALLNRQRIVSMIDHRSLDRKTDGYTVEFIDQEADWAQRTYRILRPNIAVNPGLNTYSPIKLDFTTGYNQAMWHARRLLAKEKHRPGEVKLQMGKEGRYCKPGSLIKVQNERFKIGLDSGEIVSLVKSGDQIVGLKLMEKFDISRERDYWVEYYVVDEERNHVVTKQIQSVGEFTDTLLFTVPIETDSNIPEYGNILSAMYGERTTIPKVWEAKRYIVTDLSENSKGYDLTLAEYAEDIYRTGPIQDRISSILSTPPMEFTDQQLRDYQLLLEALGRQTTPQTIDRIARDAAGRVFGQMTGIQIDLSNEWVSLAAGYTGANLPLPNVITSQATLFKGSTTLSPTWSISSVAGVSISSSGLITINTNYTQSENRREINVNALYEGVTYTTILAVQLVRGGANGEPAIIYELLPSVDSISRNSAGTYTPTTISCKVLRITGSQVEETTEGIVIKYVTSANNTETVYNPQAEIPISGLSSITFRLYRDGILVDAERVPVVSDGQDANEADVARLMPRFRGVYYVPGLPNGTINDDIMNLDDWVYYAGSSGAWSTQYVYQWTSTGWVLRLRPSQDPTYGWLYLDATSSIGEGMPVGMFSDVFCQALTSTYAFIRYLYTHYAVLRDGGWIQSENYNTGNAGFIIKSNGDVEFNTGTFRGTIYASSGIFHGRIEALEGIFNGKLRIGDAWTDNGAVDNRNARGSVYITDQRNSGTNYEVRIKNLNAYGETNIGLDHGNTTSQTRIFGRLSRPGNEITVMDNVRSLSGDYTASQLYNLFNAKYSGEGGTPGPVYPINGSLFYKRSLCNISYLEYPQLGRYELRGIRTYYSGIIGQDSNGDDIYASSIGGRFRIVVTSSQILIYNVNSNGASSLSETISGSDTITADFLFL